MVEIKNHIWITENDRPVLGNGRYQLLLKILETGSLSKAAKEMSLSYKKAWKLINSMNSNAEKVLVETSTGGKNGGGTHVTEYGLYLMDKFCKAKEINKLTLIDINDKIFNHD